LGGVFKPGDPYLEVPDEIAAVILAGADRGQDLGLQSLFIDAQAWSLHCHADWRIR